MHIFLEITSKIAFYQNSFLYNNHNFPHSTFLKKIHIFPKLKSNLVPFRGYKNSNVVQKSYVSLHVVKGGFAHNVIPTREFKSTFVIRGDVTENDGLVGSTRSDLH